MRQRDRRTRIRPPTKERHFLSTEIVGWLAVFRPPTFSDGRSKALGHPLVHGNLGEEGAATVSVCGARARASPSTSRSPLGGPSTKPLQ